LVPGGRRHPAFQLCLLLSNSFVQVASFKLGKLGGEQPAITLNISAVAPNLRSSQIIHRRTSTVSSYPFRDGGSRSPPEKIKEQDAKIQGVA
jgi:hypothetical protein